MSFVHIGCKTHYSIQSGVGHVKEYFAKAKELGMKYVCITDTCNMYSALEMHKVAKSYPGITPVYGAEIWLWEEGVQSIKSEDPDKGWNIRLLIKNKTGYNNLSALITEAIFHGIHYRPRIDMALLEKHSEGLVVTSAGINGPIGSLFKEKETKKTEEKKSEPSLFGGLFDIVEEEEPEIDKFKVAKNRIKKLESIFGKEDTYIEIQNYGIEGQSEINSLCKAVAHEVDVKTIVTNDVRYKEKEDSVKLDVLYSISREQNLLSGKKSIETDQQYMKSEEEMLKIFTQPEDIQALQRTEDVAKKCSFVFKEAPPYFFPATNPPIPDKEIPMDVPKRTTRMDLREYWADTEENWEYFYKAFPPPKSFNMPDPNVSIPKKPDGVGNMSSYFEWYCKQGLEVRLKVLRKNGFPNGKIEKDYWERLNFEMNIIEEMGFPAYMLIVAEFINWSKDNDIPVGPGRGSAAGSIVAWATGITDVNPLQFNLLFERFLNPERVSMPDIDVDFAQAKRHQAIEHTQKKYGEELVSQIITYGKIAARSAVKDVCRSLGIPFFQSNEIAKLVPEKPGTKLKEVLEDETVQAKMKTDPMIQRIFELAKGIEGTTRQVGIHAAGVVIADRPLVEHSPLYRDNKRESMPVIQYDMGSSETIGLIKFDFLGLKTLDQIDAAVKHIKANYGKSIDIGQIDLNDKKTYKLLSSGDTVGVFQLESSGMQSLMRSMRPENIEDVIASIALYRPGPLSSGMDKSFVECKKDPSKIQYLDPRLEKILGTTYGSMVYQEQVMQIAQDLAGYSLGEADLLRRAMGKKKVEVMKEQKIRFVEGFCKMADYAERSADEVAEEIFDLMAYFAGYGFNKSHSAAYGMISYQTAWLKAHYRTEFFAALMTVENDFTDKIETLIDDCKTNGNIKIMPPNVNVSTDRFEPIKNFETIIYSLSAIKRIGEDAAKAIVEARKKCGGKFKSFHHFLQEVGVKTLNKRVIENLIKSGSFDWTGKTRSTLLESYPGIIKQIKDSSAGHVQQSMFFFDGEEETSEFIYKTKPEWDSKIKAKNEIDSIGFYLTSHPASDMREQLTNRSGIEIMHLKQDKPSGNYLIGGIIMEVNIKKSQNGSRFAILKLEDETSNISLAIFSKELEICEEQISIGRKISMNVEKKMGTNGGYRYNLNFVESDKF